MVGDILLASLSSMEWRACGRRLIGFAGDETGLRFDLLTVGNEARQVEQLKSATIHEILMNSLSNSLLFLESSGLSADNFRFSMFNYISTSGDNGQSLSIDSLVAKQDSSDRSQVFKGSVVSNWNPLNP